MNMILGIIHIYKTFYVHSSGFGPAQSAPTGYYNKKIIHQETRLVLRWLDSVVISALDRDDIGYNLDVAYKEYNHSNHEFTYLSTEVFETQ